MATQSQRQLTHTITDVMKLLRVERAKVKQWVESGELESFNVGTEERPQLRIRASALDAFMEERKTKPQLQQPPKKSSGLKSRWGKKRRAKTRKRTRGKTR